MILGMLLICRERKVCTRQEEYKQVLAAGNCSSGLQLPHPVTLRQGRGQVVGSGQLLVLKIKIGDFLSKFSNTVSSPCPGFWPS